MSGLTKDSTEIPRQSEDQDIPIKPLKCIRLRNYQVFPTLIGARAHCQRVQPLYGASFSQPLLFLVEEGLGAKMPSKAKQNEHATSKTAPNTKPANGAKTVAGTSSTSSSLLKPISTLFGLVALSLASFAYERVLVPLYGSAPTNFLLNKTIVAATLAAVTLPFKITSTLNNLFVAIALSLAPNATYWGGVMTSRRKDPIFGPATVHSTVIAPIVFYLTRTVFDSFIPESKSEGERSTYILRRLLAFAACSVSGTILSQKLWGRLEYFTSVSDSEIFLGLAAVAWTLWILNYPVTESEATVSKKRPAGLSHQQVKSILIAGLAAVGWSSYPLLCSPVLPHPLPQTYTHPTGQLQIHSAVQSKTGLIIVGEGLPPPEYKGELDQSMHSARYLRADHSILGGVWTRQKVHTLSDEEPPLEDVYGAQLGDSVYATFVIQEAARMVDSTERAKENKVKDVLIIGLGTGISATSFQRHGLSTTIVEIDPAVYDAARTFFGLPDPGPGKVFLEDARKFVSDRRKDVDNKTLYDIVVHDVFSGGGVPGHIFTLEFWNDVRAIMQPEGVVVVNFAGVLDTDATRMVLITLEKAFGQCRAFHDVFEELQNRQYATDFINMVLFCSPSKTPLTFRKSNQEDWLGSPLRRHVLSSLATREVDLNLIRNPNDEEHNSRFLLTDTHNPLPATQKDQGKHHWKLMREVLPDIHWETF